MTESEKKKVFAKKEPTGSSERKSCWECDVRRLPTCAATKSVRVAKNPKKVLPNGSSASRFLKRRTAKRPYVQNDTIRMVWG